MLHARWIWCILLSCCVFTSWAGPPAPLTKEIADLYLRSFALEKEVEEKSYPVAPTQKGTVAFPKLSNMAERAIVLRTIFSSYAWGPFTCVLNKNLWRDLHLFYGTPSTPDCHILSRINRTRTVVGECALATLLVMPTASQEELCTRQRIIQLLGQYPTVLRQLQGLLEHYRGFEPSLLSFWTDTDPLYDKAYTDYMARYFYGHTQTKRTSARVLELKKRVRRDFFDIQFPAFFYPLTSCLLFELINGVFVIGKIQINKYEGMPTVFYRTIFPFFVPGYSIYFLSKQYFRSNPLLLGWVAFLNLHTAWKVYRSIQRYKEYANVLRNLAGRMVAIQEMVQTVTKISEQVAAIPALEAVYGSRLVAIRELLRHAQEPTELGRLVRYLQDLPLTSWSYFWHNAGKLLASFQLFVAYKEAFVPALYELGQFDAFVGITQLVQELKDSACPYSFTAWLDQGAHQRPYIQLTQMWHPLLDVERVVGNDLTMDASPGGASHILLTGPNAGGKSTFLSGVAVSLLLSQTLGIAPAHRAVITPFSTISTYMSISQEVLDGKSLFRAEVDRVQEHMDRLALLPDDAYSFAIFDEPFRGTNPIEGAAAGYSVLSYMAGYTNGLSIVATHYPMLTLLAQKESQKGFVNYKVGYLGKKIGYTYQVVPGVADQTGALDLLEEQGCAAQLIQKARELVAGAAQ